MYDAHDETSMGAYMAANNRPKRRAVWWYGRLNKPRGILPMAVAVTAKVFNLYPLGF
jgi:hypothetical protein